MTNKTPRQFGLWDSPMSPKSLAGDKRLSEVQWDSDGRTLVWLEGRSDRGVLVAQEVGGQAPRDLTTDLSVRAEVGYGGGDFTVHAGQVYFVADKTGRIWRQPLGEGRARAVTPPFGQAASPTVSPDGRWLAYVHHDDQQVDRIAIIDTQGAHWPQIFAAGADFYMQPCWSADGRRFAWVAWNHPQMPWDGTLLCVGTVVENSSGLPRLTDVRVLAGSTDTAVSQPQFVDANRLAYVSDETGWGRVVLHDLQSGERRWLTPDGIEYGMPAWRQGMRTLAVVDVQTLIATGSRNAFDSVARIDLKSGAVTPIGGLAEYTDVSQLTAAPVGGKIAFIGSAPHIPPRVVAHDLKTNETTVMARASGETLPQAALSRCEAISWPSAGGDTAHGLLYAPASEQFEGVGQPPLIAIIHGGPTSQVKAGWRAEAQFFATRGYAVLHVNYRGGTGYGREYMLKLRGNWGICDVEDAVSGARHLADTGRIDAARTAIMGGSAGGFTVLQTMSRQPEAFAAGVSMYGVANQFGLAADTHKFESRYLDTILGPLPEAAAIYRDRSPLFHASGIRRPLAVFQGDIDRVVPREQSDTIVEALRRNHVEHVYHVYQGEGHGWRKRETIEHFYQAVDGFLRRHLIFS